MKNRGALFAAAVCLAVVFEIGRLSASRSKIQGVSLELSGTQHQGSQPSQHVVGRPPACKLQFQKYEPSKWEQRWRADADKLQDKICETIKAEADLVHRWLSPMEKTFSPGIAATDMEELQDDEIWSHFLCLDTCTGKDVRVPIEPLVGLMRHPTVQPDCALPDNAALVHATHDSPVAHLDPTGTMENKGYMVIQPYSAETMRRLYPGRKYLFDLGTGKFSSGSLPWFLEKFSDKHIDFDEIFGWEVKHLPQDEYWQDFPGNVSYKMHFLNVPCPFGKDDPGNPLNIVRSLYKPGDFVAFKLDIDNEEIENALMSQLDEELTGMIATFFFEQHFQSADIEQWFGKLQTSFSDALEMFHRFRSTGLRIHYWP